MRLWSLHPSCLDGKGLVALWREALLARKVLQGKTRGYRHHPQLHRFQAQRNPQAAIESYLWGVYEESVQRGYRFDVAKLSGKPQRGKIRVTVGQLHYEWDHLMRKLKRRDMEQYRKMAALHTPPTHPLFRVVTGEVEEWERIGRGQ